MLGDVLADVAGVVVVVEATACGCVPGVAGGGIGISREPARVRGEAAVGGRCTWNQLDEFKRAAKMNLPVGVMSQPDMMNAW